MTSAAPSDPTVQLGTTSKRRPYAFTDEGQGPAVIALHGAPGSVDDWRWFAPHIVNHMRLIRLDLPGFGGTPLHSEPDPRVEERAQWVVEVADDLGIERFCVLGHSLGGGVAMEIAARWPGRTWGLALIASVGLEPHKAIRRYRRLHQLSAMMRKPLVGPLLTRSVRRGFVRAGFRRGLTDDAVRQAIHLAAAIDFDRHRSAVEMIDAPALVAWAPDDALIEDRIGQELSSRLRDGPRLRFDSGGHNLQKARADEIGKTLVKWAQSLRPHPPGAAILSDGPSREDLP